MLKVKQEIALNAFRNGYNCAQSVLKTIFLNVDLDMEQAMSLASGFGGGMGRLQKSCGAVSGAFMALGMHNTKSIIEPEKRKQSTTQMIQVFHSEFIKIHGASDCRDLLGCDLNTIEGQEIFESQKLGEKVCENCINSSVEILHKMISSEEKD